MPDRKRRERLSTEDRRERLIALGTALFSERAFDEISIDDIAAHAGISKGLLYHYFPTKHAYYAAVVERAIRDLQAATEPDPALAPEPRLRAALDAHLAYVEEHVLGVAALLRAGVGADPRVGALVEDARGVMARRALDVLADLGTDVTAPGVRVAVRGWVGFVEAATLEWAEHGGQPRAALLDLLVGMLLAAVGSFGA